MRGRGGREAVEVGGGGGRGEVRWGGVGWGGVGWGMDGLMI